MIEPILPMFITLLGGDSRIVGLIGGLRDSIASLLKVVSGFYSDKIGRRKPFVFFGYFLSSVFKLLLGVSRTPIAVLFFMSFERLGKGLRTAPRDALLADSMPKHRGKSFGVHRFFDSLGSVFGAIIVLLLIWFLRLDYKVIIVIAALFGFFALIPLFFVKEPSVKKKNIVSKQSLFKLGFLSQELKLFLVVSSLFALANINYMFFILKVQDLFVTDILKRTIPILFYILFNTFYSFLAIPFGRLSDRTSKPFVLLIGYFVFAITMLGFAVFDSLISFALLFILYGVALAMINSNQRAFVADLSRSFKATSLGVYHTLVGVLALFTNILAGFLYKLNPSLTFYYAFSMSIIAFVALFAFKNKL
ncbi:MFS transporter [Candidatus Woesearchaeota archaeon ex4484_78]|nr:MAG: MFS transporter [Candidatus Woesearchaeota archaeon ex4484_78]